MSEILRYLFHVEQQTNGKQQRQIERLVSLLREIEATFVAPSMSHACKDMIETELQKVFIEEE